MLLIIPDVITSSAPGISLCAAVAVLILYIIINVIHGRVSGQVVFSVVTMVTL